MADTSYYHASTPFFSQSSTIEMISTLRASGSLSLFCGAGVTIDRTGRSWATLVQAVMTDRLRIPEIDISKIDAMNLLSRVSPLDAASISYHYLRENSDDESKARQALHSSLQNHLYPPSDWGAGSLVDRIVELCAARASADSDLSTTILTTNYDTFVEDRFRQLSLLKSESPPTSEVFPGLEIRVLCGDDSDITRRICEPINCETVVKMIYLHGRIPPEGAVEGNVAFAESDYLGLRESVTNALIANFEVHDVLVLGSSLSDPPLMSALWRTKNSGRIRCALQPMASLVGEQLSQSQAKSLVELLPARALEFDVELLLPDFFSQLGQFVEELSLTAPTGSLSPYERRIRLWWDAWSAADQDVSEDEAFDKLAEVHVRLGDALDAIREELGSARRDSAAHRESLKLELWVRVPTGPRGRALQLWASSAGVVIDTDYPRLASLALNSAFAAVRAFQLGRPTIETPSLDGQREIIIAPYEPRWSTFLSVPVDVKFHGGRVPAGVITLASNQGPASRIRANRPKRLREVVELMTQAARDTFDVQQVAATSSS